MGTRTDFDFKRRKYIPVFPKASGKPTVNIEGYPSEDDQPMSATGFHGVQITTLSDQLKRYFGSDNRVYIGVDSFVYYQEGDRRKFVAPDIYVVYGAESFPERRSFYTWAEGAVPVVAFEFLSESTAAHDQGDKIRQYLVEIEVDEYFIHQPEGAKSPEFRGWCRSPSGEVEEMGPDAQGGLFSHVLNMWLRWEYQPVSEVRLLRPYLPDGTPIPTSGELKAMAEDEKQRREQAEAIAQEATQHRQQLESELEQLRAEMAALRSESSK